MKVVDGWIGKNGNTIKALLSDANVNANTTRMIYIRKKIASHNEISSINVRNMITLYKEQYAPLLSSEDEEGIKYILETALNNHQLKLVG